MLARVIAVSALLAAAGAAFASDAAFDRQQTQASASAQNQAAASAEAPRPPASSCGCCQHGRS
jgi:hypothetical protein